MRTNRLLVRSGLTVVAVATLPLVLAAPGASAAASGISVSTSGSTVSVTTTSCAQVNGSFGNASLLSSGQSSFAQGRQAALAGANGTQSAAWSNVGSGTFTVVVVCSNGTSAGQQAVAVSASSTRTPASTSASPTRGVLGGMGGSVKDYGPLTLAAGGALVATGTVAAAWFLRRRTRPRHY
ncbi:hypothetical protein OK074_1199 [Actinobacteria bacterium OK074]|nr:hypothetical protein OK074_1199 [Actinobacteria bacterium OK074]